MNDSIKALYQAVRQEDIDGWLFYGFRHRDPLSCRLLGIPEDSVNTRRWFYILLPDPNLSIKICHEIEAGSLKHLPGKLTLYSSLDELKHMLFQLTGLTLAAQISTEIPAISYLDCGTADLLRTAGVKLVSASVLIQRTTGVLDQAGMDSHNRCAVHLYDIVNIFKHRLASVTENNARLYEGDLQRLVLDEFENRGLVSDHPPIVAAGINSADPHYSPEEKGSLITGEQIVQLDLWAKEPGGIYADISWVFFTGRNIPLVMGSMFSRIKAARDAAAASIKNLLAAGTVPSGADIDTMVRKMLRNPQADAGRLLHRTGHSIDSEPHGSGVNLDAVEFPDTRPILPGSCFSIEPGLYGPDFGMRTEINAYVELDGSLTVSGGPIQEEIVPL